MHPIFRGLLWRYWRLLRGVACLGVFLAGLLIGRGCGVTVRAVEPPRPRVVTLAIGRFNATDQEAQEAYFSVGTGASVAVALVFHPKGEAVVLARELVGQTGMLLWVPDTP